MKIFAIIKNNKQPKKFYLAGEEPYNVQFLAFKEGDILVRVEAENEEGINEFLNNYDSPNVKDSGKIPDNWKNKQWEVLSFPSRNKAENVEEDFENNKFALKREKNAQFRAREEYEREKSRLEKRDKILKQAVKEMKEITKKVEKVDANS